MIVRTVSCYWEPARIPATRYRVSQPTRSPDTPTTPT
jgi:hypothetical protein